MDNRNITVEEWLAELERAAALANDRNNDALTVREMSELTGRPGQAVRELLRRAIATGQVQHCRKPVALINGTVRHTDAYRPVKQSDEPKSKPTKGNGKK